MDGEVEMRAAPESAGRQKLDAATQALLDEATIALSEDRVDDAVVALRRSQADAPDHAQIRSLLGLALARSGSSFAEARELCESAAKQEFFNPELYLNLAKVYLRFDRRGEALRYLRRGQMIDPGHEAISETIVSLGRRRLPLVPFLPRRHPVNRALGNARSRFMGVMQRA